MKSIGRAPKCGRASFNLVGRSRHAIKSEESIVLLIAYYVVFMIAGDLAAYAIGRITEFELGGQASLIVFLALYFASLWIAWVLAVWMTEPRHGEPESRELA
jgi:cation transporter-like permease